MRQSRPAQELCCCQYPFQFQFCGMCAFRLQPATHMVATHAGTMCPLPSDDWCTGDGLTLEQVDCGDGDSVLDWVCTHNVTAQRKVVLSSNCTCDHWPQADKSLCPPRFARECLAWHRVKHGHMQNVLRACGLGGG